MRLVAAEHSGGKGAAPLKDSGLRKYRHEGVPFRQLHWYRWKECHSGDVSRRFRAFSANPPMSRAQRQVRPHLFWRKAAPPWQRAPFQGWPTQCRGVWTSLTDVFLCHLSFVWRFVVHNGRKAIKSGSVSPNGFPPLTCSILGNLLHGITVVPEGIACKKARAGYKTSR